MSSNFSFYPFFFHQRFRKEKNVLEDLDLLDEEKEKPDLKVDKKQKKMRKGKKGTISIWSKKLTWILYLRRRR